MFRCFIEKCESLVKHPEYSTLFCPSCHPSLTSDVFSKVNFFKLYQIPESYNINKSELSTKYKNLQFVLHPDILRSKGIKEQNYSKLLQESYKVLIDDLSRAEYMLSLQGFESDNNVMDDLEYLEEQIDIRSKISEASQSELQSIMNATSTKYESLKSDLLLHFTTKNYPAARASTTKLHFTSKILEETKEKLNLL